MPIFYKGFAKKVESYQEIFLYLVKLILNSKQHKTCFSKKITFNSL